MKEFIVFNSTVLDSDQHEFAKMIYDFDAHERMIGKGKRNKIKIVTLNNIDYNIKNFKLPNFINQIVYKFFRKSKARRSFEYAEKLLSLQIKTPKPIAFFEYTTPLLFKKSYYISEHLAYELTYRELINIPDYPNHEEILRLFTQFTFQLHEKGINFLDHSPGNTLIRKINNGYEFYLVDLNRMEFHEMSFDARMKNFAKLSPKEKMLEVMADEYAKCYTIKSKTEIMDVMGMYAKKFSERYKKKERFKAKYYFWRNKS